MRRFPAIALLSVFGFALIVPVFAAGSDSKLPVCCRREGQHRCGMAGPPSEAGAVVQALCPACPKTGVAPAYSKIAVAGLSQAVAAPAACVSPCRVQTETLAHNSFSRTRQKRGPPARNS